MIRRTGLLTTAALLVALASVTRAQQPATAPADSNPPPAVGDMAPDFTFRAITKDGIAPRAAKLSDYRGQTVVLWFFIKARTRG